MRIPELAFGAAIEKRLSAKGLCAFSAQELLGASDSTILNWISGRSFPPRTRIPALAAALGLSVDELTTLVDRARASRLVDGAGHQDLGSCTDSTTPDDSGVTRTAAEAQQP